VIDGQLIEFVRELRNRDGGVIGVHASISLARTLIAAGLVDELRLVVAPTIVGSGQRLLEGLPSTRLELVSAETSPSGHLLANYRVGG
jgi:dihydrofolate reductase